MTHRWSSTDMRWIRSNRKETRAMGDAVRREIKAMRKRTAEAPKEVRGEPEPGPTWDSSSVRRDSVHIVFGGERPDREGELRHLDDAAWGRHRRETGLGVW